MASNVPGTRPSNRQNETVAGESNSTTTTVVNPAGSASTGVKGVAVYDQGPDGTTNSSVRPSASMIDDAAPARGGSSGSMIGWIIGIIVLIVLAYFLLQMIF